jgi:ABC-type transporter Mla maintaining outer membrane lipid asymmetry ATPase subunit MlaF
VKGSPESIPPTAPDLAPGAFGDSRTASSAPILEMEEVAVASLRVPERILIDPVNWAVHPRDFWVIGGPPASGKSDFIATAAGLMRPARGRHRLFGQELARLHEEERLRVQLRIGVVFGLGGRLFNELTVAENLGLPLCYHRNCTSPTGDPRVRAVLEALELTDLANLTPLGVPRNLRERVGLARALILSPELLILDSPLAALDPRESRWWGDFLERLVRGHPILDGKPATLVLATDDLRPWGERGRQFAFIQSGRFLPVGSRADLVRQTNPSLRELIPADWLSP